MSSSFSVDWNRPIPPAQNTASGSQIRVLGFSSDPFQRDQMIVFRRICGLEHDGELLRRSSRGAFDGPSEEGDSEYPRLANTARIDPEEFVASPACAGDAPTARSALPPAAAPSTLAACPSSRRRVEKPCRNVPGRYQLPRPSVRLVDSRGTPSLGSRDFSTSVQIEDRAVPQRAPGGVWRAQGQFDVVTCPSRLLGADPGRRGPG